MYAYSWDTETGGLLLSPSPLSFSKEPRPVYYKELDILGFNRVWNYAQSGAYPYMWAEANNYFYRGRLVAKTKGGSLYTAPELVLIEDPEPKGQALRFVDIPAMVEKNRDLLEKLARDTIKKIYNTYIAYKNKVDVFYVAFSGGKDSVAVLDLVQRALPHNAFKVLFGDTGMEFPDTYDVAERIEKICKEQGIEFLRAKSKLSPIASWQLFGPPATVIRWCCGVHKTIPQINLLREITEKSNFTGMAFIGIRASESLARSKYDYLSLGEKHKGQYSCNPILEWNSAELFCYIYTADLVFSESYKKGNRRAGCLVCPRAAERNDYLSRVCYTEEVDKLVNVIKELYRPGFSTEEELNQFISNGGWKARKNGRDIAIDINYHENIVGNKNNILIQGPRSNWKEWIKTIGILQGNGPKYTISFKEYIYEIYVYEKTGVIEIYFESELERKAPLFIKLLKNIFRKSACCVQCGECEVDCHDGYINMKDGNVHINNNCKHCYKCHKVDKGCLVYKSLEKPKAGLHMAATKSLNCYSHHAPKIEWFKQFFELKDRFSQEHLLGSQMYKFFKRFLNDAKLLDKGMFSNFAKIINSLGLNDDRTWALMFVNLSYSPQINWLVKRTKMLEIYNKEYTLSLLLIDGAKESWVKEIWSSFARLMELPFSIVGMGNPQKEKNRMVAFTREPWASPNSLVILYSLYKFAEACGGYYQFTLTRLLDHAIESDGVSPTEIFGLDRETMEKIVNGLSVNYPDFITARFTLNLDTVTLNAEKTSTDALALF